MGEKDLIGNVQVVLSLHTLYQTGSSPSGVVRPLRFRAFLSRSLCSILHLVRYWAICQPKRPPEFLSFVTGFAGGPNTKEIPQDAVWGGGSCVGCLTGGCSSIKNSGSECNGFGILELWQVLFFRGESAAPEGEGSHLTSSARSARNCVAL